ncbi:LamG domain-containing protein, partial [Flavobacteriales bacterium]|nr:LamG domain-containing protein [Flavobacteriales bacterium]
MNRLFLLLFGAVSLVARAQVPDYVPTEGLVAWYALDGDGNDWGPNGYHMDIQGASFAQDWQGNESNAMSLVEEGDYGALPAEMTIENAAGLTFSWRAKSLNWVSPTHSYAMDVSDGPCDNCWDHRYGLSIGYGYDGISKVAWSAEGAAGTSWVAHWVVPESEQDQWIYAVGTLDMAAGLASLYINGQLIEAQPISTTEEFIQLGLGNEQSKIIGRRSSLVPSSREFTGFVDDIGIWNRALTEEEILALYNAEPPAPGCTDPTACNFDEEATSDDGSCVFIPSLELPADTVTFESSLTLEASSEGSQSYAYLWHTGDTASSIEVIESGLYSVQVIQEESANRSVRFDANSTELADFSSVTSFFENEGTIAIDFKIETPDSLEPDLGGNWSVPSYPLFYLDNGEHDPLAVRIGKGCYANEASITLEDDDCGQSNPHVRASWGMDPLHFFDGEWHRMVLSSGSEGHSLYVDGNLLPLDYTMGNPSINVWPEDANVFNLGRELNADWDFVGELDNLTVWSYPLDSNQASVFAPCQVTQLTPGLLGFWPFDNSDSSSVLDASGNNHHGILNASRTLQPAETACEPCYAEGIVMVQLLGSS